MTYYVYVISTIRNSKLVTYVGYTNNLKKRLNLHNKGKGAKFTRGRKWKLIYYKTYYSKTKALKEECSASKTKNCSSVKLIFFKASSDETPTTVSLSKRNALGSAARKTSPKEAI